MAKKIDMGETWECCPSGKKMKPEKHYPRVTVPQSVDPALVGKKVTMQVDAKVVGVNERKMSGKTEVVTELEIHTVTPAKSMNSDYARMRRKESRAGG